MKKNSGIAIAVIVVLLIALVGWGISSYNSLVSVRETVDQSAGDIQTNLQRRADLIPNLVETVKGYAAQEKEIYTAIADARSKLMGASGLQESAEADAELNSALSRLLVVVENYPELKSSANFIALQDQLEGTENRINVARTQYNEAVKELNAKVQRFPGSIIAGMFGFEKADYFEASEGAQSVPQVQF